MEGSRPWGGRVFLLLLGSGLAVAAAGQRPAMALRTESAPTPASNLVIQAISVDSNGAHLTIGYPEDFTNRLDIFACSDLLTHNWTLLASNLVTTGGQCFCCTDASATQAAARFYKVGNADLDSDGDGLPDMREILLYKTKPFLADTDQDGLNDGEEIAMGTDPLNLDSDGDRLSDGDEVHVYRTDPNNPDIVAPLVSLTAPTGGATVWWIP